MVQGVMRDVSYIYLQDHNWNFRLFDYMSV